jgi:predicted  nucleic acid-binding Zn-ribbon protein
MNATEGSRLILSIRKFLCQIDKKPQVSFFYPIKNQRVIILATFWHIKRLFIEKIHKMKLKLLIVSAAVIIAASSCTDKEKLAQMQTSIDSLRTELSTRDTELTEYFALVSDIESNINEIKQREKMISIDNESNTSEKDVSKRQIVEDLKAINNLMADNKANIDELNKKLKNSYYQTGKFKKMVTELEERVSTQATEIETLNIKVNELVAKNETLSTTVDSLFTQEANKAAIIAENETTMQNMDEQLHTAYYTTGTSDELIEKHIISKEGGFIGIGKVGQINPQINKNDLTMVDIRDIDAIPVNSKKLEIVTKHPQGSYEIVVNEEEKQVDKLLIIDPDKFWGTSKYLVMVKK